MRGASNVMNVGKNAARRTTRGTNSVAMTNRRRSSGGRLKKRVVSGRSRNGPNDNGKRTSNVNSRSSAVTRNFKGSATRKISATKSSVAPTKNRDDAPRLSAGITIKTDSANGK